MKVFLESVEDSDFLSPSLSLAFRSLRYFDCLSFLLRNSLRYLVTASTEIANQETEMYRGDLFWAWTL